MFYKIYALDETELFEKYIYLGEGAGRRVFAINEDLVIKVAKGKFGILQNKIENYVYTTASKRHKRYLCPVMWYKPWMVVMKKALPLSSDKEYFDSLKEFCQDKIFYRDILALTRIHHLSPKDIRAKSSWGLIEDDNKVLIDYGCPSRLGYWRYRFA